MHASKKPKTDENLERHATSGKINEVILQEKSRKKAGKVPSTIHHHHHHHHPRSLRPKPPRTKTQGTSHASRAEEALFSSLTFCPISRGWRRRPHSRVDRHSPRSCRRCRGRDSGRRSTTPTILSRTFALQTPSREILQNKTQNQAIKKMRKRMKKKWEKNEKNSMDEYGQVNWQKHTVVDIDGVISRWETVGKGTAAIDMVHSPVELSEVRERSGPHPYDKVFVFQTVVGVVLRVQLPELFGPVRRLYQFFVFASWKKNNQSIDRSIAWWEKQSINQSIDARNGTSNRSIH